MQLRKPDLQRILFISGTLSLVIVYIFSWVDVISDPIQRTGSDFIAFYAAGRSVLEGKPGAAYELAQLKAKEEDVLGFAVDEEDVNPFVHPPLILPILWLMAHLDYLPAFHLWALVMLILCALCAYIASKLIPPDEGRNRIVLWIGVFLFFPLFISLVNGQDSALLLLGAMLWHYGLTRKSHSMAGLGLALTTIRPQIALVLAVPFLFHALQRKVWWWFCIGGTILALASIAWLGWDGVRSFLNILSVSASGEGYKINEAAMVNLIGLVKRLAPNLDASIIRTIGWAAMLVGLLSLCVVWSRASAIDDRLISLAVVVAVFTSPHLHYHDLALLAIPILGAIRRLAFTDTSVLSWAVLIPFGISLLFLITYSISPLNYLIVLLVELTLLIVLWRVGNRQGSVSP